MIELCEVTNENMKVLQRLDKIIFPVTYNRSHYRDLLNVGEFAKLAFYNGVAVGTVCCRPDVVRTQKCLYIMTLGCLPTHRRLGIGTLMLKHVLRLCEEYGDFQKVYLHVHAVNEDAIKFYETFGFAIVERLMDYYKRLEMPDAFVLEKVLGNTQIQV